MVTLLGMAHKTDEKKPLHLIMLRGIAMKLQISHMTATNVPHCTKGITGKILRSQIYCQVPLAYFSTET